MKLTPMYFTVREVAEREMEEYALMGYVAEINPDGNVWRVDLQLLEPTRPKTLTEIAQQC